MSNYHRRTLEAVFRNPVSGTIVWADVESMLLHFGGEIRGGRGSRVTVVLNGKCGNFHRPHPQKEAPRHTILKLRQLIIDSDLEGLDEVQGIYGVHRIRPG